MKLYARINGHLMAWQTEETDPTLAIIDVRNWLAAQPAVTPHGAILALISKAPHEQVHSSPAAA